MKKVLFLFAPTIVIVLLVGFGVILGEYLAKRPFRSMIHTALETETLGPLLNAKQKKEFAGAYFDPSEALRNFNKISWAPPSVLTPFVGNGLRPGKTGNAVINAMQFRMEGDLATPKPKGVYRIFLTGGSTAYSSGAPSQERTIAGYLEEKLNREIGPVTGHRYEVIIAANCAWASTHERIIIENKLMELEPDLVVSFSGNNDVLWGSVGRDVMWFYTYTDEHFLQVLSETYDRCGYGPMEPVAANSGPQVAPSIVMARLEKNIRLATFALNMRGAKYLFVLQPTLAVTRKELSPREKEWRDSGPQKWTKERIDYFQKCYNELRKGLPALHLDGFTFGDGSVVFDRATGKDEIFLDAFHFGDRGNKMISDMVFGVIRPIVAKPPAGEKGEKR